MSEQLQIYDLKNKLIGTWSRDKYYSFVFKEYQSKKKVSRKVKGIRVLIMNSEGRIYLQKRSKEKLENPGLYDKTVGGHVVSGQSFDLTLTKECAEELGFPISIVSNEEFDQAIKVTDLETIGLVKKLKIDNNFISFRRRGDTIYPLPGISQFYLGYYNGAVKFKDGEACGIETYSLPELKQELKNNPGKFTEDLHYMVKHFSSLIKPVKQ